MIPSPNQSDIQTALRTFLLAVLPPTDSAGNTIEVVSGVQNLVAEPTTATFVEMTPLRFERIETNIDSSADVKFTGSITGNVLTVTAVAFGVIELGATIFGPGVAVGTVITKLLTGEGGNGTYQVSNSQTISSQTLSSGGKTIQINSKLTVQLDFHSVDTSASDMANTVAAALRDDFGTIFFSGLAAPQNSVAPLYADDPKYMPFINDQQQYEWRWVLEAVLQANQVITAPQQYTDVISVVPLSVEATFPD